MSDRIDLAHAPPFRLGALDVRPSTREVVDEAGAAEVVEPRVMQVLVALARANGAVVSRDDLTRTCWENRVVGDDAINRVIGRVRRLAEGPGRGRFHVETVTRVGYRLVQGDVLEAPVAQATPPPPPEPPAPNARIPRRTLVAGGVAGAAVLAGVVGWWRSTIAPPVPMIALVPKPVEALMDQAFHASRQANPEGLNQAIGLFKRVVEIAPFYADGWGALAGSYAAASHIRSADVAPEMVARTRAAAERAFALDRDNAFAKLALLSLLPRRGTWWRLEQAALQAKREHPGTADFDAVLYTVYSSTGRMREAAVLMEAEAAQGDPSPQLLYRRVVLLWAANRLEEADRAMDQAYELYPTHFAVWFTRFYLLMYTGRPAEALAMGARIDARPSGIPERAVQVIFPVARAMMSRAPADIEEAMRINLAAAHEGAGFAENAVQFASALGRLDDAFRVIDGYYFGRGFAVADLRFTAEERSYTRVPDRRTLMLFLPSTKALRADPRFERLVTELGLTRYWADSRSGPDYRRR